MSNVVIAEPSLRLQVGGTLNPRRDVYIERSEDAELLRLLLGGEYVNVLTSRQMGKSSLMVRTMLVLREQGVRTASIDLAAELAGAGEAEAWFRGLLGRLARELKVDVDVGTWWETHAEDAVGQRLQRFLREVVGAQIAGSIVLFLDEIDSTLKYPFTDALFTAIRGMYNERGQNSVYERITFCLLGVATPNELIKDRRTTAYNVGQTLELRDFDLVHADLHPLAVQLHGNFGGTMLDRVLYWTGGQPYLTVRLCAALRRANATSREAVDKHVEQTFATLDHVSTEPHFQQILRFIETRLTEDLHSLEAYGLVLKGKRIHEQTTPAHLDLKLSGLVKRDTDGYLIVRNRIYERLFDAKWLAATLPRRKLNQYRNLAITAVGMIVLLIPVTTYLYVNVLHERKQVAILQDFLLNQACYRTSTPSAEESSSSVCVSGQILANDDPIHTNKPGTEIRKALSGRDIVDVLVDSDSVWILASRGTSRQPIPTNLDGSLFPYREMFIIHVRSDTDVAVSDAFTVLPVTYLLPDAIIYRNGSNIECFINYLDVSRGEYNMMGAVFTFDSLTLNEVSSQSLFKDRNWGWYPQFVDGTIKHWSSEDGYYWLFGTTKDGNAMPVRAEQDFRTYQATKSADLLPPYSRSKFIDGIVELAIRGNSIGSDLMRRARGIEPGKTNSGTP